MLEILKDIFMTILGYLKADWYFLLIGILLAVVVSVYLDSEKLKRFLQRRAGISIPGAVAIGALTPLCACGTMAVLLSMFVSAMPWGTVMAFLISSPLTSPSEYMFETAFFGSKFATGLLVTSIALGILAGLIAHILERRTKFFDGQFRLIKEKKQSCECSGSEEVKTNVEVQNNSGCGCGCSDSNESATCCEAEDNQKCGCGSDEVAAGCDTQSCGCQETKPVCCSQSLIKKYKIDKVLKELWNTGIKKILLYFIIFIAAGRVVELIIPQEWIMTLFSGDKAYSIPLAATIGLPLYLTDSSAMPLLKSFINSGAGEGAVLAFMIAGKATGVPVIAGMATFMKKKAMLFYIGCIYFGAIIFGYLYQIVSPLF